MWESKVAMRVLCQAPDAADISLEGGGVGGVGGVGKGY